MLLLSRFAFFRSQGRRQLAYAVATLLVILIALFFYERPAHHYDTAYASCWRAEVNAAIQGSPPHLTGICSAHPGTLPGVGRIVSTEPITAGPRRTLVLFLTDVSTGSAGLAYVVGVTPPPDTCVTPLGGPWWQFRSANATGACPRGYAFQPAP